jgi:hypothetical protein
MLVLPHRDLIFAQVSRVVSRECKLQVKDFRPCNGRFSATTSSLLTLHHCHCKGTTMHIILVLWARATIVVRVGTTLIGVQENRKIRLQPQSQIRTSTAMPTIVHLL